MSPLSDEARRAAGLDLPVPRRDYDALRSELLPLLADCVTFLEQAFAHSPNKPACLAPAKAAVEKYSA